MSNQNIYNRFRTAGMTHAGALAMLGNGFCESDNIPYRVQGDFSADLSVSKTYTKRVDNGEIGYNEFVYNGPGGGGYGLFQWTWSPRKAELFNESKKQKRSIGDEDFQVDFAVKELKRDFAALWSFLCKTEDLHTAVSNVCYLFENPAIKNVEARYRAALNIEQTLDTYKPVPVKPVYWPPRTIDRNMSGDDVAVLQAVLKARGYSINYVDGKLGDVTDAALRAFQADVGLTVDGVCGPMTWKNLLAF